MDESQGTFAALLALTCVFGVSTVILFTMLEARSPSKLGGLANTLRALPPFIPTLLFLFGGIYDLATAQFQMFVTSLIGVIGTGAIGLVMRLFSGKFMPYSDLATSQLLEQCSIPGYPFNKNFMLGVTHPSQYMILTAFYICMYIGGMVYNNPGDPSHIAGYVILGLTLFIAAVFRWRAHCNNIIDIIMGISFGMLMAGATLLGFMHYSPHLVPFTPAPDTSTGSPSASSGATKADLPSQSTQCARKGNQEFVCHAYRNGKKLA